MKRLKEIFWEYFAKGRGGGWRIWCLPKPKPDDTVGRELFGVINFTSCFLLYSTLVGIIVFPFVSVLSMKNNQFAIIENIWELFYMCCGLVTVLIIMIYEFRYDKSWFGIIVWVLVILLIILLTIYFLPMDREYADIPWVFREIFFLLVMITSILRIIYLKIHDRI